MAAAPRWLRIVASVIAIALPVLCVVRLIGWWPCAVSCNGGGAYASWAGISTLGIAAVVYASLAANVVRGAWLGAWRPEVVLGAWMLVGVSAFFVSVMIRLGLPCSHCLTVHSGVLILALLLIPAGQSWQRRGLAALLGFLLANLAFHHQPLRDAVDPATITAPITAIAPVANQSTTLATIDANRSLGSLTAPWRLDMAIDLTCPHCADLYGALITALQGLTGDRLRLVTRCVVRRSAPASGMLGRYALAAAAIDRSTWNAVITVLLGSRTDAEWASVRTQVAEVTSVDLIEQREAATRTDLVTLQRSDQRELLERNLGTTTPGLALIEVASGRTVRTWSGELDPTSVAHEIQGLISKH